MIKRKSNEQKGSFNMDCHEDDSRLKAVVHHSFIKPLLFGFPQATLQEQLIDA